MRIKAIEVCKRTKKAVGVGIFAFFRDMWPGETVPVYVCVRVRVSPKFLLVPDNAVHMSFSSDRSSCRSTTSGRASPACESSE